MARVVPREAWLQYIEERKNGATRVEAAKHCGISFEAATAFDRGSTKSSGHDMWMAHCFGIEPFKTEAIQWAEINLGLGAERLEEMRKNIGASAPVGPRNESARLALDDFDLFRQRYMGRSSTPWQILAAERVVELLLDIDEQFLCMNVYPGAGKSMLKHDISAWLTTRDRTLRGINGSRSERLATPYTAQLRRTLESVYPLPGAAASLSEDYGPFKPPFRQLWRDDRFIVYQADGRLISEKDPSWQSFGMESSQHGPRGDIICWDDLVDPNKDLSPTTMETQRVFLDGTAQTRLEFRRSTTRGGLFWLIGQRVGSDDVYKYSLDKRKPPLDFEVMDQPEDEWPQKYVHISFPVHVEEKCTGDHADLKPWPESCLMDPVGFPWRKIAGIRADNPRLFSVQYQQEDVDPDSVLCDPAWLNYDEHRTLWQSVGTEEDPIKTCSIVTIDPSGTKFWGQQAWLYAPAGEDDLGGQRYLMDVRDAKGEAPDLLNWEFEDKRFTGVLEEWRQNFATIGKPLRFVIVEINAMARFLTQQSLFQRWCRQYGITPIKHTTGVLKTDPRFGVWATQPNWRHGRVVLPAASRVDRAASKPLTDQVTRWPGSMREDEVMAYWFMERNLRQIVLASKSEERRNQREWRPSWMRDNEVKSRLFNRVAS